MLFTDRRFSGLFWTQFLGAFNDNFLKNAMVILIAYRASHVMGIPAAQMVPLSGGIFILPFFLFSATAGQLSDKYRKPDIIRIIKLVEIAIMVCALVGFVFHQFAFLMLVLFLMGMHSTFFGPVKYAILPQLLGEEELVGGNALIEAGSFLAILGGTIAGGMLITMEPAGPWIVSIGLIIVAVMGYLASRTIPMTPAMDPNLKVQWNPIPPTLEVWRFTQKNRTVFLSVMGISWFWFYGAAFLSLFPPYCKEFLNARESVVTLFLATFSVGIGIGSVLCERFSKKRLELGLVPLGSIGMTVFAIELFLAGNPFAGATEPLTAMDFLGTLRGWRVLVDLLLISISSGFYIVPLYTLIQERTEPSHRSRVIASNNIVNAMYMVVASIMLVGFMKAGLTVPQIFLTVGLMNAAIAIYIYTTIPEFLLRFIAYLLANVMYRIRVTGDEKIPREGGVLLVCNHVTYVDAFILTAAVRRPIRFVMDHNYAKGFMGYFLTKRAKVIPIAQSKDDPTKLQAALDRVAHELAQGDIVCIFPEGTLTRTGEMNKFRTGVEKIVARNPVPVVPMAMQGLWGSFFSWKDGKAARKRPRRFWSRIQLVIGDPVAPAEAKAEHLQTLVAALRGTHA